MSKICKVAPLVGAWIEIALLFAECGCLQSLLSWERGLKYGKGSGKDWRTCVAPLVGAWIEILESDNGNYGIVVAPLVGAWIEIYIIRKRLLGKYCRSSRGSVD